GDLFKVEARCCRDRNSHYERQQDREKWMGVEKVQVRAGSCRGGNEAQNFKCKISAKCSQHHHFAMREIDHKHDAVYKGVADGDERVHAPQDQSRKTKTDPCIGAKMLLKNNYVVNSPKKKCADDNSYGGADIPFQTQLVLCGC